MLQLSAAVSQKVKFQMTLSVYFEPFCISMDFIRTKRTDWSVLLFQKSTTIFFRVLWNETGAYHNKFFFPLVPWFCSMQNLPWGIIYSLPPASNCKQKRLISCFIWSEILPSGIWLYSNQFFDFQSKISKFFCRNSFSAKFHKNYFCWMRYKQPQTERRKSVSFLTWKTRKSSFFCCSELSAQIRNHLKLSDLFRSKDTYSAFESYSSLLGMKSSTNKKIVVCRSMKLRVFCCPASCLLKNWFNLI